MDIRIENIVKRQSIRKYKKEQITDEELQTVIDAGLYAASGMNKQSAIVIAIQNKELRDQLSALNASVMGASADPFYGAPTVLVVLANTEKSATGIYDGALMLGNMMQAASQIGLGSCWIHRAKEEFEMPFGKKILADLGIQGHYEGIGHLILGYPDEAPVQKPRNEGRYFVIR